MAPTVLAVVNCSLLHPLLSSQDFTLASTCSSIYLHTGKTVYPQINTEHKQSIIERSRVSGVVLDDRSKAGTGEPDLGRADIESDLAPARLLSQQYMPKLSKQYQHTMDQHTATTDSGAMDVQLDNACFTTTTAVSAVTFNFHQILKRRRLGLLNSRCRFF